MTPSYGASSSRKQGRDGEIQTDPYRALVVFFHLIFRAGALAAALLPKRLGSGA